MNLLQSIAAALSRKPGRTRPARSARERRAATPFKRTLLAESIEQRVLLAADPLSVARVNGSVDSAGEVDHFSFHLDNAARLSFDSLTENGNLHWNLVGPAGAVVNGASFRGFSGSDGNYAPLDLGAGDYRVDVYGSGDTTGAYDMRLLDLARATPIALDSVVSGSVDQAGQTLAFTFDAHAGDNLYLTWQQHPDAYLRIYDPYGQQVNSNYGGGQYYDSVVPTLAYSGRYTVLLDASGGVPAGAGYGFTLHRMVTPVTEAGTWSSAVLPFSGTLAGAGDNAVLHFTLGSARSVMLDSFTWNDSMLLSMSGPQGQVYDSFGQAVANVPMGNYVDRSYYARGRLDLAAGDYTVVLRGNGATTGDYGLRLLDLAAATVVSDGQLVSGVLSPGGAVQLYAFDGSAGESVNIHPLTSTPNGGGDSPGITVLDPLGRRISYAWNFTDLTSLSLGMSGRYTIVVSGQNWTSADDSISFRFYKDTATAASISLGTSQLRDPQWVAGPAAGETAARIVGDAQLVSDPSAALDLTGNLTVEAMVRLDAYSGNGTWTPIISRASNDWNHQSYGLWVGPQGQLNLDSNAQGSGWAGGSAASAVPLGQWVRLTGVIDRSNGLASVYVDGTLAGQWAISTPPAASLPDARLHVGATELVNGGNHGSFNGAVADVRVWSLARSGAAILAAKDQTQAGTEAGLVLNLKLDEGSGRSVADSSPNAIGVRFASVNEGLSPTLVEGAVTQAGGRVAYSLTSASDRTLMLDSLTVDSRFTWSLVGPDGQAVVDNYGQTLSGRQLRSSDYGSRTTFNLRGGLAYKLVVDADGDTTGHFALRLLDFAAAPGIAYGATTTWQTTVANSSQLYAFNAAAGDQVSLERISYTDPRPNWRLYDPLGREIWASDFYYGSGTLTLGLAGRYTVALEGSIDALGTEAQSFRVNLLGNVPVTPPASTPVDFVNGAAEFSGTLATANETQNFSFTLSQATRIYVDALNSAYPDYYTVWTLTAADHVVTSHWGYDSDGLNRVSVYDLGPGTYSFSVTQPYGWTGVPFRYRVLDAAAAQPVAFGDAVNGTLAPANSAALYDFSALAGDHVSAAVTLSSNMGNAYWRVIDPSTGAVIAGSSFGTNLDAVVMPHDGHYLLSVEGYYGTGGTASYGFTLTRNLDLPQPLVLGTTVQATIGAGGGRLNYSVTLDHDSVLYFDPQSVASTSEAFWSVTNSQGQTLVGDTRLGWYNGYEGAGLMHLAAGSYTLSMRTSGGSPMLDHFAFRLLDTAAVAAPLSVNADTTGTLNPGSGAAAYAFDATAGQRFFFQATGTSNGNLRWRLIDPTGADLTANTGWGDYERVLGNAGRYTLLIEGFNALAAPVDYNFRVALSSDLSLNLDPAAVATASPQWTSDNGQPAVALLGTRDIRVEPNPALNQSGDVSFQVRVRVDSFEQTWQSIVYKGGNVNDGNQRTYTLWVNSTGYLYLTSADAWGEQSVSTAAGTVQLGQWLDVTGVVDRGTGRLRLYVNGALAGDGDLRNNVGPSRSFDTPLYLGNAHEGWGSNTSQLQGAISEFRLWNRVLTANDISGYQTAAPSAADSHLVAWLKLDEGSGATLADSSASHLSAAIHSRYEGLAGVVQGRISIQGQQAVAALNLPQSGLYYLDTLTGFTASYGAGLNLIVNGPRVSINENLSYFNNRPVYLAAGDYRFTVDGNGRNLGNFAFRVVPVDASSQQVAYGQVVSGDLNPGDSARFFQFDATAGEQVYLQNLGYSGHFNPAWRLLDPFGREVFGRSGMGDRDATTLAYSGRYTVIVDGDYGNYDQRTRFSFRLINVTPAAVQSFDIATGLDGGVQRNSGADAGSVQVSATQFLELPNAPSADLTGSYTLDTRFRIDRWSSNSWTPLLIKSTATGTYQVGIFVHNDGRIQVGSQSGGGVAYSYIETASGLVTADAWHDLAAVYDRANGQIRVVLDGVQVATGSLNPNAGVSVADPLRVGYNNDGNDYSGGQVSIDRLSVWNRALSTPEAAALHASAPAGSEAGLAALYDLNETSGAMLSDALGGPSGRIVRSATLAGGLVAGRLTQPGQTQHYRFTLDQTRTLYFDSLTRRSDIRWTLSGPSGAWGDSLLYGDANGSHGLMTLAAGSYDIVIDGDGAATGDYLFRLLDAANARTIATDQVVEDTLSPGQVAHLYHFDASAGQRVYFDLQSATPNAPVWRLIDPSGATLFGPDAMGDRDTMTLARSGSYTLIIEGQGYWTSYHPDRSIKFQLRTVTDQARTITLGSNQVRDPMWTAGPSAGEAAVKFDGSNQIVTAPSAALDLTGDLTLEAMVKVDGFGSTWTPLISRGSDIYHQTFGLWLGSSGQVNLDSNWQGNYWNVGSAGGLIQAGQWYRVSATIDRTHGLASIYVNGSLMAQAGIDGRAAVSLPDARTHVGSTDINNGDRAELYGAVSDVRIWSTVRSGAEIAAAQSQTLSGSESGLALNLKLDEGQGRTLADSSANAIAVADADLYGSLGPTVVEGAITQIGSRVVYSLSADTDRRILFDSLTPDSRFTWTLTGPNGVVRDNYGQDINGRRLRDSDAWSRVFFNLRAGVTYTLTVDIDGDGTGNYGFRLLDFAGAQTIAYDTPTTWAPDEARTSALFAFDAAAGDQIVLDRLGYSDTRPLWRLFDPYGSELYSNDFYYDSGTLTLNATGRYTVALEGQIDSRGAQQHSFQVSKVGHVDLPAPTGTPLAFVDGAAAVDGNTLVVNEAQVYTFTLAAPKRVYVDTLNSAYPNYYQIWNLSGPSGTVAQRWAYDTDGPNARSFYDLAAGSYSFSVWTPYSWATSSFAFRLVDVDVVAQPITAGAAVSGTLDPANSARFYSVEAAAGDRLFIGAGAQNNTGSAYWRVIDASTSTVIAETYFSSPLDGVVIPHAGRYLISVEGYYGVGGSASYDFTVYRSQDGVQALTLGDTVSGSLGLPGNTQRYSFALSQATRLWFDSLTPSDNLRWSVLDRDGQAVVGDRGMYDYPWTNNSRFDLGAGSYTLVIDGRGATAGAYGFRLLDLAAATPITPGTTVVGQLAPANKTQLYRFDATAGQQFYFDVQSRSGGNTYWRLLDPSGNAVFWAIGLTDAGTRTLAYTGTYTLAVEGYPDDVNIGYPSVSYSFNITPVVDQAPVALAIGVLPGPNLQVHDLAVAGADASGIHSGGSLLVQWSTANVGDRASTGSFQERVVVKNAAGETLVNQLVDFDAAVSGSIAVGAGVARSATVALPAGARGAGALTVSVFTDVGNAIVEQGEGDNSAQVAVTSTLLTYPDLVVTGVGLSTTSGLAAGDAVTVSWNVANNGDKATAGTWADRVLVRNLSTGEVVLDQVTRVSDAQSAVAPGGSIARQLSFTWPGGRKAAGSFELTVSADVQGEVAEFNASDSAERNNDSSIQFTSAPDLTVDGLQLLNANPVSGDTLNLQWTVHNAGNAPTPAGWFDRVQVVNLDTGESLVNVDVAYDPVAATGAALAAGGSAARNFSVRLPDGQRAVGHLRVTVSADQNASGATAIPETSDANNSAAVDQAVTLKPYPNLAVTALTVPVAQRSGDAMPLSFTVTNQGTLATDASAWIDRVILSADATIGNGDDIVLANLSHNGALAAGAAYTVSGSWLVPGSLDGNYRVSVVTDAFGADTEPDNRADNTATPQPVLLTAYHADLQAHVSSVPAAATGATPMTVSWHVDNTGDAGTSSSYWYDQLWLSPDGSLGAGAVSLGAFQHSGALASGAGYDASVQVTVPNGISGNYTLVLVTDVYNHVFESRFDGNNTAVAASATAITLAPSVNLVVQNVTGPALSAPGQTATVEWDVANAGVGTAVQPWTDQVFVSRDGTMNGAIYLGSLTHGSALPGGQSYHASVGVGLPDLADGAWRFVVVTDVANQVYESGVADAESANGAAATAATQLVHPDLRPTGLTVSALTGGQSATLNWTVRNDGSGDASGNWVENVYLSSDATLDGGDVFLGQVTVTGGLAAGATAAQSLAITPPVTAAGSYRLLVLSDAGNNVREAVGEGNNLASLVVEVTQAPLPDLMVSGVTGPASGLAGRDITVGYDVVNGGNLAARGDWTEQVFLSADNAVGGDVLLANFFEAGNDIAAGARASRSRTVTLPGYAVSGNWHLVVRVDAGNTLPEGNELNNAELSAGVVSVGNALSLLLNTAAVNEASGAAAVSATVVRSGDSSTALTVSLGGSVGGLTLPASVLIPAGQASASFLVGVVDNLIVDGNRDRSILASANGYADSSAALRIVDNDVPALALSATATTVSEAAGPVTVTLTRNTTALGALTVNLSNNKPNKLTVPDTVGFAAGQASVSFTVTPVNDTLPEGDRNVDISASVAGFNSAGLRFVLLDDDIPSLTLNLASTVVSEGAGAIATYGTLTRSIVTDNALTVLLSGTAGRVKVPTFVTFAAGQATVDFNIGAIDNTAADGDHTARIGAAVADQFSGAALASTRVERTLLLGDDDGPTLSMSIDTNVVNETGSAIVTLTRNTPADHDLVVQLSSTDTSEATVPASVVIAAGQQSVSFAVSGVQDGQQDGTQNVQVIASAAGFNSGNVALQVTDRDLADLQVGQIDAPLSPLTGQKISITWTDLNAGFGDATGNWSDSVYLSADANLTPDDQLVGSFNTNGPLAPQTVLSRSIDVKLGTRVGNMWVFVVTDAGKTVTELAEANNIRAIQLDVRPSYTATVQTDVVQAPAGTVVQMTGSAKQVDGGAPQAFSLVRIKVVTNGYSRNVDVVTDKNGNFKASFTPLPSEAGHYTIGAVFPGVPDVPVQDSFDLLGMRATNGISASLIPGQTVTGTLNLQNLSPVALTAVQASVASLPPGITLSFDGPATLSGDGTLAIGYTLSADASMGALNGGTSIVIGSAEGIATTASLSLQVNPLVPQLVANPGYLSAGMLRGAQNSVSFEIVNTGGAATGPLQVQLPADVAWMSLSSSATIADLAPGARTTVTLLLSPGADLALQRYDGTLNVVGSNSYVTVPFQFRAVSDRTGDVQVTVTDEYTFFAADKPNLAGATVQLLDPYTYAVVATATTDATGIVNFTGVAEGAYALQVNAPSHDSFRTTVHVTPGGLDSEEVFLHRQAVTYTWTVVPTEIQDHYRIVLESTFQTEVPMPVVTVDNPFIMPWVFPGVDTQFNITMRNHGLVDATHVSVVVPQNDPNYIITPLVDEIPVLAAKSEATIPCTIRLRDNAPRLQAAQAAGLGDVATLGGIDAIAGCLGIEVKYTYICVNNVWQQVPLQIAAIDGCLDSIKTAGESVAQYLEEHGAGNLLSAGCDVISAALQCAGIELSECENALLTTACAAGIGALEGGPVGALGGALGNWADILACLCTLDFGLGGSSGGSGPGGGGGGGWGWGGYYGGPGSPYSVPISFNVPQVGCSPLPGSSSTDTSLGTLASNGVCAEVRLRIEQSAVITRTAFQGTLELNNGHSDTSLTDATLTLDIRDANGNDANGMFVVRGPTTQNVTVDGNGHWTIDPSTIGKIFYTFVPTNDAAPDAPTVYSMGGTLHYNDNGTVIDVPLLPARITVYPEAKLNLDYFWQRDVVGDDPFTDPVEASEPFALGLQVVNIGKGGAGKLTITSAQPEIVENEKGLLVNFKIIGSQVGNQPGSNSLTVDLGNIAPGGTATAQWNLLSSLQGKFKDFSASFEHLDDNGDLRTSLINQVKIHELTHALDLSMPASGSSDGIPDYLANDVPDAGNLPDTLYFSTGGQAPVTVATQVAVGGGGFARTVSADMQGGWSYLVAPDVLPGYELVKVTRSDGKTLSVAASAGKGLGGMVWRTDRSWLQDQPGAVYENLVKLVDFHDAPASGETYTFTYAVVDHLPPTVLSVGGLAAGAQTAAVDAVDITFSEPIDPATLTAADLKLSLDGVDQALPAGLSVAWVNGDTWRVSGLAAATGADGNYRLVVDARGVTDLSGNAGTNSASIDWAMGANAPVVLDLAAVSPSLRNTPVTTLDVAFSRAMNGATLDFTDLQLTRDGADVPLNGGLGVVAVDASHFRLTGLDGFTSQPGSYVLTVRAAGTQDANGVAGTGAFSRSWTLDTAAPSPVAIEEVTTDPRNIVVMSLDVTTSEAVDAASFDWHDITLTKDASTANLITSEVTVTRLDATHWRVEGFNWKVGLDGRYTLTVNGAGLRDLAGNAGTGSVSRSWTMDKSAPLAPTQLQLSPDTGADTADGLTRSRTLTLTGALPEDGLRVRLTDLATGTELGLATVDGRSFSHSFTLGSPGAHHIRLRVADAAGNLAPDSFVDVFVDEVAPGVSSVAAPTPNPRTTAVDTLDLAFDEAIDASTVDRSDITLTRDGVDVPLDASVTLTALGAQQWRIGGLAAFTAAPGVYQLTVDAAGVRDLAGNGGVGRKASSWTTLATLPTEIRGQVYEDLDGSGSFNPAHWNPEAGIAGATVYLDANDNGQLDGGEQSTLTLDDGSYRFGGLAAGHFHVRQQLPAHWLLTQPTGGQYDVTLAEGHTASAADFGNFHAASLSGVLFSDADNNGTRGGGETPLSGWTVFLDANANGVLDAGEASQLTGTDGSYAFADLAPGTVAVQTAVPAGWHRSTPEVPQVLKSGEVIVHDLGLVQLGRISGMKFNDLNGNGAHDDGEGGVAGWTIFLDANTNGVLDSGETSTLTDTAGQYQFDDLLPGSYTVAEVQRAGWVQTKPLPNAVTVGVSTAGSSINLEADCACGGTWATYTGPTVVDYGKLAMDTALATTGITELRQSGGYVPLGTLDGRGTTTVVIDTGIDLNHPFFGGDFNGDGVNDRIVYQWDFANNDADASDLNGHGSNVSSIIGSQDGTYAGVAPGTQLIVLKVFEDSGKGTFAYLEKALQWVLAHKDAYHIDVVNMSLGDNGNWEDTFSRYGIGDELAALAQTDTIMLAAAGNNYLQFGKMGVAYPGSDPAVIAVGATWAANFGGPWTVSTGATNYTTGADQIAAFSQRSTDLLDTFAPGARFNGANANGGIVTMQGTSQAAAFVSGAAALAQQIAQKTLGRDLSTGEFATLLHDSGDLVMDGDDEVDNVVNTQQKFPRLDMVKLAAAIARIGQSGSAGDGSGGASGGGTAALAQQAAAGVHNLNLAAGQQVAGAEFGNFQLGRISGTVYDDANASGARDAGEHGLADVKVYLDGNDNGSFDAGERFSFTAADGSYAFGDLVAGALQVRVQAPAGKLVAPGLATVTVTSGLDASGLDFGLSTSLVNHAPTAGADSFTVHAGQTLTVAAPGVLGNDSDLDGDALHVTSVDATGLNGQVFAFADGSFSFTPTAGFSGDTGFSYTLADAYGGTAQGTVTVHVTNAAPTLDAIADRVVAEGSTLSFDLGAHDGDDAALHYSLLQGPAGATLDPTSGRFSWTASDVPPQTVQVQVSDPSGASATRQFRISVELGRLVVTSFANTGWGFAVRFNDVVDPSMLNVANVGTGVPDVAVVGAATGAVRGSVVMDDDGKGFVFIRTGAQLPADRYTVTIRGAADGVVNARRGALDGDTNGSAGGSYGTSFSIAAVPAVRLRLPDFARGPNQAVNIPATGAGIPVSLSSNGTVTDLRLRLRVDTDTLAVSEVRRGADLPADATLSVTPVAGQPGQWDIVVTRATPLPVNAALKLLAIVGTVPNGATLGDAGALVLSEVRINGVLAPLAGDAAVDLVGYPGDMDFDGRYTADDVTAVSRTAIGVLTGLAGSPRVDAAVLADVDGNGSVNALDTAQVLLRSRGLPAPMIPVVPEVTAPVLQPLMLSLSLPSGDAGAGGNGQGSGNSGSGSSGQGSTTVNLGGNFSNFSLTPPASQPVLPLAGLSILPSASSSGVSA